VGRGVLGTTAHPMPPIPGAVRSVATPNHPKKILVIAAIADAVPGPTKWWGQTHGDTVGMKTPLRHGRHGVGGTIGAGATVATEDRTTPETMIRETAMLALLV
jgi:hypothetical protein